MTGQDLRELRVKLGLTQAQMARLLGVHRITLVRWESGTRPIDPLTGAGLRHKLECIDKKGD